MEIVEELGILVVGLQIGDGVYDGDVFRGDVVGMLPRIAVCPDPPSSPGAARQGKTEG